MGRVEGKVALISGGARNIGGATARMLLAEGARVVIGDLLDDEGEALAAELRETAGGDAARYVHLDVTSEDDWTAAVALTVGEHGRLDVLFNNAGIFNGGQLQRYRREQWQEMLDVNLTGAFLGMKAAADAMIASGGGSIVNTSSIEGLRGTPWAHGYVASKWGLRGLMRTLARELAPHGVTANCVCPNFTRGERTLRIADETAALEGTEAEAVIAAIAAEMPLGRVLDEDDTASAIAWLVSDAGRNITGIEVPIEGGLLA